MGWWAGRAARGETSDSSTRSTAHTHTLRLRLRQLRRLQLARYVKLLHFVLCARAHGSALSGIQRARARWARWPSKLRAKAGPFACALNACVSCVAAPTRPQLDAASCLWRSASSASEQMTALGFWFLAVSECERVLRLLEERARCRQTPTFIVSVRLPTTAVCASFSSSQEQRQPCSNRSARTTCTWLSSAHPAGCSARTCSRARRAGRRRRLARRRRSSTGARAVLVRRLRRFRRKPQAARRPQASASTSSSTRGSATTLSWCVCVLALEGAAEGEKAGGAHSIVCAGSPSQHRSLSPSTTNKKNKRSTTATPPSRS